MSILPVLREVRDELESLGISSPRIERALAKENRMLTEDDMIAIALSVAIEQYGQRNESLVVEHVGELPYNGIVVLIFDGDDSFEVFVNNRTGEAVLGL